MGSLQETHTPPDDPTQPPHQVTLSGYYLQTTEVTNGEVERFLLDHYADLCPDWKDSFNRLKGKIVEVGKARDCPAVGIPHHVAVHYARMRGGRLPTEAQWEFAARSRGREILWVWDHLGKDFEESHSQLANLFTLGQHETSVVPVGGYPHDVTAQ